MSTKTTWKKVRALAMERDGGKCVICLSTEDLTVDHIVPLSAGGKKYNMNNLQTLCKICHSDKDGWRSRSWKRDKPLNREFSPPGGKYSSPPRKK
jgi:5-methylcytosine-specific restriction endonuclease McrA